MRTFGCILLLLVAVSAQVVRKQGFGPKEPIVKFTIDNCYESKARYIADLSNLCWYWECVQDKSGIMNLIPRRCALGSRMPFAYSTGLTNPCLFNFNTPTDFDCTRTQDSMNVPKEPDCVRVLNCNGKGNVTYEGNICWCKCEKEWSGAADCSKRTTEPVTPKPRTGNNTDCWNNKGERPPCDRVMGCANGGVCHNQCNDFWCDCPTPFTNGKRCESFSCSSSPCRNGGTCNRGEGNKDEVNACTCPKGYSGLLCEITDNAAASATTAPTVGAETTKQPVTAAATTTVAAAKPAATTVSAATTRLAAPTAAVTTAGTTKKPVPVGNLSG